MFVRNVRIEDVEDKVVLKFETCRENFGEMIEFLLNKINSNIDIITYWEKYQKVEDLSNKERKLVKEDVLKFVDHIHEHDELVIHFVNRRLIVADCNSDIHKDEYIVYRVYFDVTEGRKALKLNEALQEVA